MLCCGDWGHKQQKNAYMQSNKFQIYCVHTPFKHLLSSRPVQNPAKHIPQHITATLSCKGHEIYICNFNVHYAVSFLIYINIIWSTFWSSTNTRRFFSLSIFIHCLYKKQGNQTRIQKYIWWWKGFSQSWKKYEELVFFYPQK